jgi:hypothetical protein
VITVGIDDTDTLETPGTNQLARAIARSLDPDYDCLGIVRHQLLADPRVPFTSKNGSASLVLRPRRDEPLDRLTERIVWVMHSRFVPGSDPGLCVAGHVPEPIARFGRRCQAEVIDQADARRVAAEAGLILRGLGGTEGGVIGALAAVGLRAAGDDGRIVQWAAWPDDLAGPVPYERLAERGVYVARLDTAEPVAAGLIDVGKHLRPNLRGGRPVLYVTPAAPEAPAAWQAVRLT